MIDEIIWKDVVGYEGLYVVSNTGLVYSLPRVKQTQFEGVTYLQKAKELKPSKMNNGYLIVSLWKNKIKKCELVHRIVANAFIPNPNLKESVNHKNGIKIDNNLNNLEWATRSENMIHAFKSGLIPNKRKRKTKQAA